MVQSRVGEFSAGGISEAGAGFVFGATNGKMEKREEARIARLFTTVRHCCGDSIVFRSDFTERFGDGAGDGGNYFGDFIHGGN